MHLAINLLHRPGHGRGDALNAVLDGRREEGNVALPARVPVPGLGGDPVSRPGHDQVERRKDDHAGRAVGEQLDPAGFGDLDGHGGREVGLSGDVVWWVWFWELVTERLQVLRRYLVMLIGCPKPLRIEEYGVVVWMEHCVPGHALSWTWA
jgi:hypothetical protein